MSKGILRPLGAALERLTVPGIQLHYALRKCYLEEAARAALDDGSRQVVILGAGFDTLALRLHRSFPTVQFIEMDHPATQRIKLSAINKRKCLKDNLQFVSFDLNKGSLEKILLSSGCFQSGGKTLFIAEGLMMYLAPDEIERLFQAVWQLGSAGSSFVFTFMEPQRNGRIAFRASSWMVDVWLRLHGEPFRWGIRSAEIEAFLARHSFQVREIVTSEVLRKRYLTKPAVARLPLAQGECICVAECV